MHHKLFVCTMYDSYGLELCTMYDSHDVYLRVLWTICMYKFSRCHIVIFHVFSFHLPNFDKNQPVSDKDRLGLTTPVFRKNQPHFSVFGFHRSSVVSGAFRSNFADFHRFLLNFSKTDGIGEIRFSLFRRIFKHCLHLMLMM
jgi:hypothetical protein